MNIGSAAKASGLSIKMIRYYEEIGLLGSIPRTESGYRRYSDADVHCLRFIARTRDLGFSVEEVASLLDLWRDRSRGSAEVRETALEHVAGLKDKVRGLRAVARTLSDLAERCEEEDRPGYPVISAVTNPRSRSDEDRTVPGASPHAIVRPPPQRKRARAHPAD